MLQGICSDLANYKEGWGPPRFLHTCPDPTPSTAFPLLLIHLPRSPLPSLSLP